MKFPRSHSLGGFTIKSTTSLSPANEVHALEANRSFYDALWQEARLIEAQRFNTWPLVSSLMARSQRRLEVGPGLRLHLPIAQTHFADISIPALDQLRRCGANAVAASITSLPFADAAFDFVCALDIVEHVDDDDRALSELCRVSEPGGAMILSLPLYASRWTAFDELAGHRHRYEPDELLAKLARAGLVVEQSAVYGMQPSSNRVVDLGTWFLTHRRKQATWVYNKLIMPLAVRFQGTLILSPGMIDTKGVDEVLLVCRKTSPS